MGSYSGVQSPARLRNDLLGNAGAAQIGSASSDTVQTKIDGYDQYVVDTDASLVVLGDDIVDLDSRTGVLEVSMGNAETDIGELSAQVFAGLNGGAAIYADAAAGIAATVDGEYFSVPSVESDESLILYKNVSTVATEIDRYLNTTALDNAMAAFSGVDLAALSPYVLVEQNDLSVNSAGCVAFNGGVIAHEVGNERIKVTASGSGKGVSFGPDLVEGKDYKVIVKYTAGTASGVRLVRNWANDVINPLVEGWNTVIFTAGAAGGFDNYIVMAALDVGDFYIDSVHIFEVTDRPNSYGVTGQSESSAVEYSHYSDDFSTNNLTGLSDYGYAGVYVVSGGQLTVEPTTAGQLFILNVGEVSNEGDWFECEVDVEIVGGEPVEFYPYWNNFGGSVVTLSTSGKHVFLLKGDGDRTATAELQHVLFRSPSATGATLRFNSIKVRRVGVNDIEFSGDIVIGNNNAVTGAGASYGDHLILGTNNSYSGNAGTVIIGTENVIDDVPLFGAGFPEPSVVIGNEAESHCGRCVAVGYQAYAGSVSSTSLGALSAAYQPHDIAVGRGAHTLEQSTAPNSICLGSLNNNDLYIGSGISSRFKEPGTGSIQNVDPTTIVTTLHGYDGKDDVDGSVPNISGGALALAGGRSTGNGVGGSVKLQTSPASPSENNNKNTLIDQVEVDTRQAANETGVLVNINGVMRRLEIGPAGSAGFGYSLVRIVDL